MRSPKVWETLVAALGMQEGWTFSDTIHVNYPVWYISVLLLCYILFYVVTYISKKLRCSARYLYLICIFLGMYINACGLRLPFLNEYTARGYYAFFLGVLLSTYYYQRSASRKESSIAFLLIVLLADLIALHTGFVAEDLQYLSTFLLFPAIVTFFKCTFMEKLCSHKFFATLAAISFNAFLWHMPVIVLLLIFCNKINLSPITNTRMGMFLFVIIAMLIGTFSHFLIEKRAILLCKQHQK